VIECERGCAVSRAVARGVARIGSEVISRRRHGVRLMGLGLREAGPEGGGADVRPKKEMRGLLV
jgi:hypothetical protein